MKNKIDLSVLTVGSRIRFEDDNLWFTVQALNEKFIVCNAITKKNIFHTIIDIEKNIRGDDNLVLHSGYDDITECTDRLAELTNNTIEVSHRNRVKLKVKKIDIVKEKKRKTYGLTSEKAERISKNTENAYKAKYISISDDESTYMTAEEIRILNEFDGTIDKEPKHRILEEIRNVVSSDPFIEVK